MTIVDAQPGLSRPLPLKLRVIALEQQVDQLAKDMATLVRQRDALAELLERAIDGLAEDEA
jgi:hypothetical protein